MNARIGGEKEGDLIRARSCGATADRVVDHIDAIGNRLIDGRRQVGRVSSKISETLIGYDARSRRDTRDGTEGNAVHACFHAGVPSSRGSSMSSVPAIITRRIVLIRPCRLI